MSNRYFNARRKAVAIACLLALPLTAVIVARHFHDASQLQAREEARERYMPESGERGESEELFHLEADWNNRLTYPTGLFNPAWIRAAATADKLIPSGIPAGLVRADLLKAQAKAARASRSAASPEAAAVAAGPDPKVWTSLGPQPEHMTGCSGCYDYVTTGGRINSIVVDPTTTTNGSIVAYSGSDGGGVWKTTNCCSLTTTWNVTTDSPLVATVSIDSLTMDPQNHNVLYAGTGDLNFGSFSMGSQGILKTTNAGASWTTVGADVFGPALPEPAGQFPQYESVGKVRVDPRNSNNVVAGTKRGVWFSYDAGAHWTGPCLTNSFTTQRQDITGLELSKIGNTTRIIAAVGVRGFATTVQYNLDQNGANGIYKATLGTSGCPTFTAITSETNGWVGQNAASGNKFVSSTSGNQLGRIDIAVAPSDPNYIYAQVQNIAGVPVTGNPVGCPGPGCQLAAWRTSDGGTTWLRIPGSDGSSLTDCEGQPGDYGQNWYDQGVAVDPTNPDRVFFDTFEIWFWQFPSTSWNDLTCGYGITGNAGVHVDQHALAFTSDGAILVVGNDGGTHGTTQAKSVTTTTDPVWFNMDGNYATIEFYAGDISGNFASAAAGARYASGGAQDNGASSVKFDNFPTGPVQWQMGLGGDGFSSQIDPVGLVFFQGNNSGGLSKCTTNCTAPNANWSNIKGGWGSDQQSFVLPINLFHGGISGGDDCSPTTCNHLLAATTRVWETVNAGGAWYITNNPPGDPAGPNWNLTKGTLGNRSFINQVKYSPKWQSEAIVGTNDGNVQIGFNLGTGTASQASWVNVTGSNSVLPNRPILGVALSPHSAKGTPVGYAAVGGFTANTPGAPGHVYQVTCNTASCASYTWLNKSGNLPDVPADSIIANPQLPGQVFVGTDFGVYYTDDITLATPTWNRFDNGMAHAMVWDLSIDRGSTTIAAWTRSRGAYVYPLPTAPNQSPIARLTPASVSAVAASTYTVAFDGSTSSDPDGDAVIVFDYDFGDGTTQTQTSPAISHDYAPGSYVATLTVTDARGALSAATQSNISVTADQLPVPSLSPASATIIATDTVTFGVSATDADAGDTLSYSLDFGDGTAPASTSGAIQHTYSTVGTLTATLTVTDSHGGSATRTSTITVNPDTAPTANLLPATATVQAGQPLSFTVTGTDPDAGDTLTYDLDFGDGTAHGTASGQVPHAYGSAGTYTATLVVSDAHGGSASKSAQVTVTPAPAALSDNRVGGLGGLGGLALLPLFGAALARRRRNRG